MNEAINRYLEKHGFEQLCLKAVLFDMDGVIYDSMPNHARSWHQAMETVGIHMEESEAYLYEGMRGVETIKLKARQQWGREISDEEAKHMYDIKATVFSQCPPALKMKGIEELMRQIKDDGLKICVVTGSGQRTMLDKLMTDFKGLVQQDLIVSSFDVTRGKPAPDPYLAGMQKTGVKPWEALVVENAPLGVQAAVAAKCFTIAVNTGPLPDHELRDKGAAIVLPDIRSLIIQWNLLRKHLYPYQHHA